MTRSVTINGKRVNVNVVKTKDQTAYILPSDAEMDKRASKAIKVALEKAKVCKKPIAKYDTKTQKAYVEYADGERKYAN